VVLASGAAIALLYLGVFAFTGLSSDERAAMVGRARAIEWRSYARRRA
jgi:hypothetical protein